MRKRRGGHTKGHEFGGSGEDSFVAVVVTKLTGALLFILLLTMVIMALLPKAMDVASDAGKSARTDAPPALEIATPDDLPEAIEGRAYQVALAVRGGAGDVRWSIAGKLPEGLRLDAAHGIVSGTPEKATPAPLTLALEANDGRSRSVKPVRITVYRPDAPLVLPSSWKPSLPPVPWRAWAEQGFGFLVLWLVYAAGANMLGGLENRRLANPPADLDPALLDQWDARVRRAFRVQKVVIAAAALGCCAGLAAWLAWPRKPL